MSAFNPPTRWRDGGRSWVWVLHADPTPLHRQHLNRRPCLSIVPAQPSDISSLYFWVWSAWAWQLSHRRPQTSKIPLCTITPKNRTPSAAI